jgi:hypothetical protein
MPKGKADYWYDLIQLASSGRILPKDINIVVTCSKEEIQPHIAYILEKQQEVGVSVEYRTEKTPCASGNLGEIQKAIINQSDDKIILDNKDVTTFNYISFINEDDALRYVATESVDEATVYFDERRLQLLLAELTKTAASGKQIILLSASERELRYLNNASVTRLT